jgi:hypothetical protein
LSRNPEKEIVSEVAHVLSDYGASVRTDSRYAKFNWKPDIIAEWKDGSKLLVDVRERQISIPDILAMSSLTSSGSSIGDYVSGAIVSLRPSPPVISDLAKVNGVILVTLDKQSDLLPKIKFLQEFARVDSELRRILKASPSEPVSDLVTKLDKTPIISREFSQRLLNLLDRRNRLVHSEEDPSEFGVSWIEDAERILRDLQRIKSAE